MRDDGTAGPGFPPGSEGAAVAGYAGACSAELDETEIIKRYVAVVKRVAIHLKGRLPETVQVDDLIQAGLIAVLRIARHAECVPIGEAMLRRSITNAMIDEARREAWAPTRIIRLAKAAGKAMRSIRNRTGHDGSDQEIAAELGVPIAQYHQMLVEVAGIRLINLDQFDEGCEEALQVGDNQEEVLHQSQVVTALADAIAALPERERMVVSLYYEHQLNMEEVGEVLGLNKSTICRAHGRALLMLRNALADRSVAPDASQQAAGD